MRGAQSAPGVCVFYNHLSGVGPLGPNALHFLGSAKEQVWIICLRGNKSTKYKEHGSSVLVLKNRKLK